LNRMPLWGHVATRRRLIEAGGVWLIAALVGCLGGQPALLQVKGRVDAADVQPGSLVGHIVEIERVDDADVRGFGTIDGEGRFAFQSLHQGRVRDGVLPGVYRGRLVLVADDQPTLDAAHKQIPAKYQAFASSGIEFQVPLTGDLVIRTERR